MTELCPGCKLQVQLYHKKYPGNTSWHLKCWRSWKDGYDVATKFAEDMSKRMYDLPTANEIYWATQMIQNPVATEIVNKKLRKIKRIKI